MLANLTSFIWGSSDSCKATEPTSTPSEPTLQESLERLQDPSINKSLNNEPDNTRCTTPEEDWVFVDQQG